MGFEIRTEIPATNTQVPNWFIRTYMPTANGNFVKIYLYLLMLCQHPIYNEEQSIGHLADYMECTESDIQRALRFWKKENLLDYVEEDGKILSILLINHKKEEPMPSTTQPSAFEETTASISDSIPITTTSDVTHTEEANLPGKQTYTPLQAEALLKDVEIEQAIVSVEQLLGSTISVQHLQLILYFMCDIGFSKDLVLTLYQTAVRKGKTSTKYIEAIGISWAKQGIKTVEEAQKESSSFSGRYSVVAKALGIQRSLAPAERATIDQWDTYHFSDDIIEEACKRTVLQTGGTNLQYVSSILENWSKQNVISLSDIEQCDEAFQRKKKETKTKGSNHSVHKKNQFQNFPQRSYSSDEYSNLEKQLLRNVHADAQ